MSEYKGKIYLKTYPEVNLGDDLFIKIIIERYPMILFYMEADPHYREIFKTNDNLSIIPKRSFLNRVLAVGLKKISFKLYEKFLSKSFQNISKPYLDKCDAFVTIGGSMFIQLGDVSRDFNLIYYKAIQEILGNKPMFLLGCNFGPYTDNIYLEQFRSVFSKAYDISFRESYSASLFNLPQVRVNPDIVFGFKAKQILPTIAKSVGFSIVPSHKSTIPIDEERYVAKYVDVINSFISQQYQVKLFSFSKKEGDETIIEDIYSKIHNSEHVSKIYYRGDIEDFISQYSSVELMFCGRFHALILSMVIGQKIIPVSYSNKMVNILKDLGYTGTIVDLKDFAGYDFTGIQHENNNYDVSLSKTRSDLHFQILDEFVGSL